MAHNAVKMTVAEVERELTASKGRIALLFKSAHCQQCPDAVAALERAERSGKVEGLRIDADASVELVDYAGVLATPTLQVFDRTVLEHVVTGSRVARALDQL